MRKSHLLALNMLLTLNQAGLVYSITGQYGDTNAWVRIFQINYFLGAPIGFLVFVTLSLIWPPRGLGVQENLEGQVVIDELGNEEGASSESVGEKRVGEKTVDVENGSAEL